MYGLLQYFAKSSDDPNLYIYAVSDAFGVFICSCVKSYLIQYCKLRANFFGMNARIATSSLMYQKVLRLSKANKTEISTGFIINLFAVDGKKVEGLFISLAFIVISPIQCVAASVIAWYIIGWPAIVGSIFSLACYPLQLWIGRNCSKARREIIKKSDIRVRIMNEIISGIKVLKMYAWEDSFAEMIFATRKLFFLNLIGVYWVCNYALGFDREVLINNLENDAVLRVLNFGKHHTLVAMEPRCEKRRTNNVFDNASELSKFLYIWGAKLILEGNRRELTEDDICEPMLEHEGAKCLKEIKEAWDEEVKKCHLTNRTPQLYRAVFRAYASKFAFIFLWTIIEEVVPFVQIYFLYGLLQYFSKSSDDPYLYTHAVSDAVGLFVCSCVRSYIMQYCQLRANLLGMNARIATSTLLYQKVLRLSKANKTDISTGLIINLFAIDGKKVEGFYYFLAFIVIPPIQCVASSVLAWYIIGWPAIVGSVFSLACCPLQLWIGQNCSKARHEVIKKSDIRARIMNEIISGIRVLKMYAWEDSFAEMIYAARKNELKCIRKSIRIRNLGLINIFYRSRTAIFLIILFFVIFIGDIDSISVYMTLAILNIYQTTLSLTMTKGRILTGEALISFERMTMRACEHPVHQTIHIITTIHCSITKSIPTSRAATQPQVNSGCQFKDFLLSHEPELTQNELNSNANDGPPCCTEKEDHPNVVIRIKNMSSSWTQESEIPVLSDINLDFSKNELTAVVGAVGAGKSSLIYAILGETAVAKGCIHVKGGVSYAAQEPWVFQGSIRENITFGQMYLPKRYNTVIRACALDRDLAMFPNGDQTIVGERGAALSGGQKARVGLARAIYRKADAYLLDDPLSAVDVGVAEHIFQECIKGFLKEKTVIVVTHQIQMLESVERIVCLENGVIKSVGSYSELLGTIIHKSSEDDEEGQEDSYEQNEEVYSETHGEEEIKPSMQSELKMFETVEATLMTYLKFGGPWWTYTFMFSLYILIQLMGSFFDLWLNRWAEWEDQVLKTKTFYTNNHKMQNRSDPLGIPLKASAETTTTTSLIVLGAALLLLVIGGISQVFYLSYFFSRASLSLHNKMFNAVLRTSVIFFNKNTSGRILNRFVHEIQVIDEVLSELITETSTIGMYVVGTIILVVIFNPFVIVVIIICVILVVYLKRIYVKTSTQIKQLESASRSPVIAHINETLDGLTTIRAFSAQPYSTSVLYKYQDHNAGAQLLLFGVSFTFGYWVELVTIAYILAVIVSLFVLDNAGLEAGNVGLMMTQIISLTLSVQYVIKCMVEIDNSITSVERVTEYASLPSEENWKENLGPGEDSIQSTWPDQGKIRFSNVSFKYEQDAPHTLENLNIVIMPREKIGIVGRTGAGKSSLISALLRMAVVEGSIEIDDVDTSTVPLQTLRSRISIIPQDPTLFSGSLRKNVDPFGQYSDDELWTALEEVEFKYVVSNLPNGLETNISEGGGNLSVGQKQLVCLARAIVRKNKILVLDEATANVDHETDALIQRTIRRKFSDNTVLTIAHRLNTVMDSDKVLVLSNGTILEFDHPHILLQNQIGHLREMVAKCGKITEQRLCAIAEENFQKKKSSTL